MASRDGARFRGTRMQRVFYRHSDGRVEERVDLPHLDELRENPSACLWVDLEGEASESLEALGRQFALHPVTIEDLVHKNQRPKLEEFDDYIFVVVHGLRARKSLPTKSMSRLVRTGS
jgi:magnesium transporter